MISSATRFRAVDLYRGVAIAIMILANHLGRFHTTPKWFRHAPLEQGITLVDLGFPIFVFILGLLIPFSWHRRRAADGLVHTALHFLKRYGILVAFGLAGNAVLGQNPLRWWSVLSTIGLAGIVSLPLVFLRPLQLLSAGLLLPGVFEVVKSLGYEDWLRHNDCGQLGGPLGCIAW
ncbi:MAG: DUF5009 domain-containing protein, partial [candidate division WOR-3 bacterium]